jgi:hypothetical protein
MPLYYSTHTVFISHVKSSQADLLYSSVLLVPIRSELTANGFRYIAAERTWTYSKHISRDRYPSSLGSKENTASSIVACWTVFTELLPGNALIKSVMLN